MRVKTLMRTRFATVTDDTPLEEARSVLAREQVETIPVVREGVLVGLLRARDIERLGPSTVTSLAAYDWAWGRAPATVRAALTADLATLTPEASVHDAIRVLAGQDLDAVPVVEGASVVGLVTTRDLLAMLRDLLEAGRPTGFEHILVALDFGEGTSAAVGTGLALARQHRARLTLLHVLPPPPYSLLAEGVPREMVDWTRRQQREQRLGDLAALVPDEPGLEVGRLVVTGDPFVAIAAAAARLTADLIVLGSRARRRLLGASLIDVLVERAPCPVLVVRPGDEAMEEEGADHARP
jgi:nucleotide-binding universal stress UspA family protein/predicted transcriptional regulator